MLVGADLTHAPPSESGESPSVAAVVASMDAKTSRYLAKISLQARVENGQPIEVVLGLEDNFKDLIMNFEAINKFVNSFL